MFFFLRNIDHLSYSCRKTPTQLVNFKTLKTNFIGSYLEVGVYDFILRTQFGRFGRRICVSGEPARCARATKAQRLIECVSRQLQTGIKKSDIGGGRDART